MTAMQRHFKNRGGLPWWYWRALADRRAGAGGLPGFRAVDFANVVLACAFDGADAATVTTDDSTAARKPLTCQNGAQLDTAQFKFGTASILHNGVNHTCGSVDHADWYFGTGAFAIQGWVRLTSVTTSQVLLGQWGASVGRSWAVTQSVSGALGLQLTTAAGADHTVAATGVSDPAVDTWVHFLAERDAGGMCRMFVNGIMTDKELVTADLRNSTYAMRMGLDDSLANSLTGWMDDIVIIKGDYLRGTDETFAVPTAPYPRVAAVIPLSLFDAGEAGGWWDPSDTSTLFQLSTGTTPVTADGQPVGYIADKSGNGRHLIQATAAARPTWKTSGGLSWLEFDGVDDWLSVTFAIAQPWERITAIRQITWTSGERIYAGVAANAGLLYQTGTTPSVTMFSGTAVVLPGLAVGANGIVTEKHAGASSRVALNNVAYVTGNAGAVAVDGFRIGTLHGSPSTWSNVRFYGGIMRAGSMSDAQITDMRAYLAAKAGVTL